MQNPLLAVKNMSMGGQLLLLIGSGAGFGTIFMAIANHGLAWKIAAGGVLIVGLAIVLYKVAMILWDKRKSGPFSAMLSRSASGRTAADPAQKAKMDSLRSKFEEGVKTFAAAGKDIYALPWYLVVGPPGSGKTEMVRRSEVGFPPGLQDVLQGSGGTFNMNWWFTNHAVMLDTAGRMFMEEAGEGSSSEWKEFLKLLKVARPNCPINGVILVLPAESVLEDRKETIESYALTISRQLDTIQRVLEVRFPVTVVISKCDKVVGFEQFFRTVNNGELQHQMLGWSNPESLDKSFSPDEVEKHLETVRQKLVKRRSGLLQNPSHTTDPNGRRTDEVDELFELPSKLMSMIPRLRQYLDKIFVASEWSPKPLFLRGIYFASSMRQGEALDAALATALGTSADDPMLAKRISREKSFFLRDMFLGKVFKEKGLVTNVANVGKAMASRRRLVVGTAVIGSLLVGGVTALSIWGYRESFAEPAKVWSAAASALEKRDSDLRVFALDGDSVKYFGREQQNGAFTAIGQEDPRLEVYTTTAGQTGLIADPFFAKPFLKLLGHSGGDFQEAQIASQRAMVEANVLKPLVDATRQKLKGEEKWGPEAMGALAQMIRLTTLSEGGVPRSGSKEGVDKSALEVRPFVTYVMGKEFSSTFGTEPDPKVEAELVMLQDVVNKAYGDSGYPLRIADGAIPSDSLLRNQPDAVFKELTDAIRRMRDTLAANKSSSTDMGRLGKWVDALEQFNSVEVKNEGALSWLLPTAEATAMRRPMETLANYTEFSVAFKKKLDDLDAAKIASDGAAKEFEDQLSANLKAKLDSPDDLLAAMKADFVKQAEAFIGSLSNQLPDAASKVAQAGKLRELVEIFSPGVAKAAGEKDDKAKQSTPAKEAPLAPTADGVLAAVKKGAESAEADLKARLGVVGPLMVRAPANQTRLYVMLTDMHRGVHESLLAAESFKGASDRPATEPDAMSYEFKARIEDLGKLQEAATAKFTTAGVFLSGSKAEARLAPSYKVAQTANKLVRPRGLYSLIDAVYKDNAWKNASGLKAAVQVRSSPADQFKNSKSVGKVLLSATLENAAVDPRFVAEPAAAMVGAWSRLIELTSATGEKQEVVAVKELAERDERKVGGAAYLEYLNDYEAYWRKVAFVDVLPTDQVTLEQVAQLDEQTVSSELGATAIQVAKAADLVALAAPGDEGKRVRALKSDAAAVYEFLQADKQADKEQHEAMLKRWKQVAKDPGTAKTTLREAVVRDTFTKEYASRFASAKKQNVVSYSDALILRSLGLIQSAGGGIGEVFERVKSKYNKSPLSRGGAGSLGVQEVQAALDDVEKILGSAGAANAGPLGQNISPPELRTAVQGVIGVDFANQEGTRQWLEAVKKVAFSLRAPFKATVEISGREDAAPPGTLHAGKEFTFAGISIGDGHPGKFVGLVGGNNARFELDVPSAAGVVSVTIKLYKGEKNPLPGAVADSTIDLQRTNWGVLGVLIEDERQMPAVDAAGSYEVAVVTKDRRHFLWLKISLPPTLPKLIDWPKSSEWAPIK